MQVLNINGVLVTTIAQLDNGEIEKNNTGPICNTSSDEELCDSLFFFVFFTNDTVLASLQNQSIAVFNH